MNDTTLTELLEAGVHFGHQKRKWNPKTRKFIFGERRGICIIDLQKTVQSLRKAADFLSELVAGGGQVLFIGTKHQAQEIIKNEAERCGMHYVNSRWLGGTLTNFGTVHGRIKRLRELENMTEEDVGHLTKKEKLVLERLKIKLQKNLGGMKNLDKLPDALIVVDAVKGRIPINEAKRTKIPVVATVDTNADPDPVDFCIPANDDAIKSISLLISKLADAILEGKTRSVKAFEEKAGAQQTQEEAAPAAGGGEDVTATAEEASVKKEEAGPPTEGTGPEAAEEQNSEKEGEATDENSHRED